MTLTTSYAAVADVQALLNALGGPGITIGIASIPTTTQVEGFLDQIAAEIDSTLIGLGYSVPVTGSTDIFLIKRYLAQKVAAMTYNAAFTMDEPPSKVKGWEDEYDTFLQRLIDGQQRLVNVSPRARIGSIKVGRYTKDA
jgi:hypothetical protein